MDFGDITERGLVLLGCGKMGGAMLEGWLAGGLPPEAVTVLDPVPAPWLSASGVGLNSAVPKLPAIVLLAVKPQMMQDALPPLAGHGNADTMFLSIAAGTTLAAIEGIVGANTPVVRAMPNTPAAVGKGITALIGNANVTADQLALAETLLSAVGATVRLTDEAQMDAVTAVSGSGPAYVFHLIEALASAAQAEGLPEELSLQLAKATVAGAGALAEASGESPTQLRINVTSPKGTTEAALRELMDDQTGLPPLMARAVKAAADRSRELGQ